MAITILQSPPAGSSMYSPLWHRASSTNVANTDFKFVFDIYVGGSLVLRAKVQPDANLEGNMDVSRIVRAYVTNYFNPRLTTEPLTIDTDDIQAEYEVQYGEEYTTGSVSTIYTNLTAGTYNAWNAYNTDVPTSGVPYEPLDGLGYQWLTNRDISAIWMPEDGYVFLSYNNSPNQELHNLQAQLLNSDGQPTGSIHTTGSEVNTTGFLNVFSLNPTDMNAADWGGITPIPAGSAGYRIRVVRHSGTDYSAWAYVRFKCEPKVDAVPLMFMNRYGGFDTFYFTGPTRRELDIERKSSQQIPTYLASNTLREFNPQTSVFVEGTLNYTTKLNWSRKLISGYLNDQDSYWLSELLASPQVFLLDPVNFYYYPVIIKTNKWTERLTKVDKMYNLEIEIASLRQTISQTR